MRRLPKPILISLIPGALFLAAPRTFAFCGFYVAKADAKLFNKASQVVIAHQDDKTIMTMSSDFQGDPKEFAVVIPVPTVIRKEQVFVIEKKYIDHLDAFTAPRLVEYFDPDPCAIQMMAESTTFGAMKKSALGPPSSRAERLGVKIEEQYTIGEYDILILSARESGGLVQWLKENSYKIPSGAEPVIKSYLGQGMKFFVAKVNLAERAKAGFTYLRPLQVAYESPKFMLPVRLGTVNATGPQEIFIYALTTKGRVEPANYRTTRIPTGQEIPVYVKDEFGEFYKAMFDTQVKQENMRTVFLEYAWDMGWCDPCAADPLTAEELKKLGVFWLGDAPTGSSRPAPRGFVPQPQSGVAQNVFVTRLHARYSASTFPDDLVFQETSDRENYQGRFVLRHPWKGSPTCDRAKAYMDTLPARLETEAKTLAHLTGWEINAIRSKLNLKGDPPRQKKWYER